MSVCCGCCTPTLGNKSLITCARASAEACEPSHIANAQTLNGVLCRIACRYLRGTLCDNVSLTHSLSLPLLPSDLLRLAASHFRFTNTFPRIRLFRVFCAGGVHTRKHAAPHATPHYHADADRIRSGSWRLVLCADLLRSVGPSDATVGKFVGAERRTTMKAMQND